MRRHSPLLSCHTFQRSLAVGVLAFAVLLVAGPRLAAQIISPPSIAPRLSPGQSVSQSDSLIEEVWKDGDQDFAVDVEVGSGGTAIPQAVAPAGSPREPTFILITDPDQLPDSIKAEIAQLPPEQQAVILEMIRTEGLRIETRPAGGEMGVIDVSNDPAAAQAVKLLEQLSNIERLDRSPSAVLRAFAQQAAAADAASGDGPAQEDATQDVEKPQGEDAAQEEETTQDEGETPAEGGTLAEGDVPVPTLNVQAFQSQVIQGDWVAVGQQIAEMPAPVAEKVYTRVLQLLAGSGGLLLPHDILALADAAPGPLTPQELELLGRLLRDSTQQVDAPTRFLAELRQGSNRLGGDDLQTRLAAARLLMAAGLLDEVAEYLASREEVLASSDAEQLNLRADYLLALTRRESNPDLLAECWELTQLVLSQGEEIGSPYLEAMQRSLALFPQLPEEQARHWVRELLTTNRPLALQVMAAVAQQLDVAYRQNNFAQRVAGLHTLQMVLDELAVAAEEDPESWLAPTQLLTLGWINEAQKTIGGRSRKLIYPDDGQVRALPVEQLMPLAPNAKLREVVDADTSRHLRFLSGGLAARVGDQELCFEYARTIGADNPEAGRELVGIYLNTWAAALGGQQYMPEWQDGQVVYSSSGQAYLSGPGGMTQLPGYSQSYGQSSGIPLTRARQVRNLSQLGELLSQIKELGLPPLEGRTLVQVFAKCHSPAEVYLEEDITRVFGPLDELPTEVAAQLAAAMRSYLARNWRAPQLQQQQNTQRTDEELAAEVDRGYQLATRLLATAVEQGEPDIALLCMLATLNFDYAEYLYGQEVELETYITLRDRAFAGYRQAHELYAASLASEDPPEPTARVYQLWFQSALGASDLAYLTRQDEPDRDQVQQVADALDALGEQADAHRAVFAQSVVESLRQMPPHLRPWCVREALVVLGEHPSGQPLHDLSALYADLVQEIELRVEIDGSAQIGQVPFGAQLYIRSTTAMARESGGFGHLLQPVYPGSNQEDTRQNIEDEIRLKLGEGFEIQQVIFHEPTIDARTFGREGWRQTPLAYLVLKAKEPAIDRIPSLQIDMNFFGGYGNVLLPISSAVELVDARAEEAVARPYSELSVTETLDDRALEDGLVLLEISANAKGLVPNLQELIDLEDTTAGIIPSGFVVEGVEDHGISVESLDTEASQVAAISRRSWLVKLAPAVGKAPSEFQFPPLIAANATTTWERYDDADIVETESVVDLPVPAIASQTPWKAAAMGLVGLGLVGLGFFYVRRKKVQAAAPRVYTTPDPLTPFTVLSLLKRIDSDDALALSSSEHKDLNSTIGRLEQRYFARANGSSANGNGNGQADGEFKVALDQWLPRAR